MDESIEPAAAPLPLRQALKMETRSRLEKAATDLIARQGYRDTTIEQIVQAAGTTRTTFYQHFRGKADFIGTLQSREIAPALMALCRKLDALEPLSRDGLRAWCNEYARTWKRIHVFFEAYYDAARTDAAVAATMLPNSYEVTASMSRWLGSLEEPARTRFHDQLVVMFTNLDAIVTQVAACGQQPAKSTLLDAFVDIFWDGMFAPLVQPGDGPAA
jgi:AcrR family transcriptional regulator